MKKENFFKVDPLVSKIKLADQAPTSWRLVKPAPYLTPRQKHAFGMAGMLFFAGYFLENPLVMQTLNYRHL